MLNCPTGTLQAHWAAALEGLAGEFLDGQARIDPLDPRNTCKFCKLEALSESVADTVPARREASTRCGPFALPRSPVKPSC